MARLEDTYHPRKVKFVQTLTVDPLQVLNQAIQLLEHGWTPNHEAVDKEGNSCYPWDERAVKWCVLGSVRANTQMLDQTNEEYNTKYIMSTITIANPSLMKMNKGYEAKDYGYVEQENDKSEGGQERAVQMVRNAIAFVAKHPPLVKS